MDDRTCVAFLQWALPHLGLRWRGFRKVRRRVGKRIDRRIRELGLAGADAYRAHLESHPSEWSTLDALCAVTISRFYRDRSVFDRLVEVVLPELAGGALARGGNGLRAWSAGCACGEEAYTLRALWNARLATRFPQLDLNVLGTDVDEVVLERARQAVYPHSSVREVPGELRELAFDRRGPDYRVRDEHRRATTFARMDVRSSWPDGFFDLVMCRNLAFTYFDREVQAHVFAHLAERLRPGGALVVGSHEETPAGLAPWCARERIFRKTAGSVAASRRREPMGPPG